MKSTEGIPQRKYRIIRIPIGLFDLIFHGPVSAVRIGSDSWFQRCMVKSRIENFFRILIIGRYLYLSQFVFLFLNSQIFNFIKFPVVYFCHQVIFGPLHVYKRNPHFSGNSFISVCFSEIKESFQGR